MLAFLLVAGSIALFFLGDKGIAIIVGIVAVLSARFLLPDLPKHGGGSEARGDEE